MTVEEQRLVNQALIALRSAVNGCERQPSHFLRALDSVVGLLEMYEDSSVPASRPLQVIADAEPLRAVR